jgi:DNA adenine methylase
MFFRLAPSRAMLSDLNADLINTFQMVARSPAEIERHLCTLASCRALYETVRESAPHDALERAVRFIYLNRNCWGGLYRENLAGRFNTPWGGGERTHLSMARNGTLTRAAVLLDQRDVRLETCDFEPALDRAGTEDVIYCDPTYRHTTRRRFDRYGQTIFDWKDQQRLAAAVWRAFGRGAMVLLSNASCLGIRELYSGAGLICVHRPKGLAPARSDAQHAEYLFVLDPTEQWANWSRIGTVVRRQNQSLRTSIKAAKVRGVSSAVQ